MDRLSRHGVRFLATVMTLALLAFVVAEIYHRLTGRG